MKKITRLSAFRGMRWKITNPKTLLYLIPAIILMVGLGSAILIYLTAENDRDSFLVYEATGGYVHPMAHKDSRMHGHDLELYGGKAKVPTHEFMHWFAGLWHGKSLAFTVAGITIYISFGFFFVTHHLLSDPKSDAPRKQSDGRHRSKNI
ncbi:MAG TPA: hypothetical protein VJ508_14040 [Saprospiraceae bacterium]|nr:hypothetical protein [Saprospiraceae bacterium]